MKRKVIKQGNGTLTITLPKKWTDKVGLTGDDEIDLIEKEDSLLVSATGQKGGILKISVDVRGKSDRVIKYIVSSLYKKGYDEIELIYDKPGIASLVESHLNEKNIGFEVIEQSSKRCLIKEVSGVLPDEFDSLLRKIFISLKLFGKSSLESISSRKYDELQGSLVLEGTNDKITNLCQRIINKIGYKEHNKTVFIYTLLWQMEKIADSYGDLCEFMQSTPPSVKLSRETLHTYKDTNELFNLAYEMFYKFDEKKTNEFVESKKRILKQCNKFMQSNKKEEAIAAHYLSDITGKIGDLLGPILGVVL